LQLAQDPAADALLSANPFALLVGMVLDQQIPLEQAFAGPKKIADRMAADGSQRVALDQQVPRPICLHGTLQFLPDWRAEAVRDRRFANREAVVLSS
jgi:uncharacterized HhH-GPD family protein